MDAHDLATALSRLAELKITPATTAAEARAVFERLDTFNHGGIFLGRWRP